MWRLNPKSTLHYRRWDDEWAVFDVASGQTHQLDTISAVALMHCENGWVGLPEIEAGVIADLELAVTSQLAEAIKVVLDQFATLGLLEHRAG